MALMLPTSEVSVLPVACAKAKPGKQMARIIKVKINVRVLISSFLK
jgi:hypothetical protein